MSRPARSMRAVQLGQRAWNASPPMSRTWSPAALPRAIRRSASASGSASVGRRARALSPPPQVERERGVQPRPGQYSGAQIGGWQARRAGWTDHQAAPRPTADGPRCARRPDPDRGSGHDHGRPSHRGRSGRRSRRADRGRWPEGRNRAACAGPRTRRIELAGRTLLPGFQDAHVHPAMAGVGLPGAPCTTWRATGRATSRRSVPTRPPIPSGPGSSAMAGTSAPFPVGRPPPGPSTGWCPIDRPSSSIATATAPGSIRARSPWPASTGRTTDPISGRIEREPGGDPSGTLHEGALDIVRRILPPTTVEDRVGRARARPGLPAPVRDHGLAGCLGGGRGPGCLSPDR